MKTVNYAITAPDEFHTKFSKIVDEVESVKSTQPKKPAYPDGILAMSNMWGVSYFKDRKVDTPYHQWVKDYFIHLEGHIHSVRNSSGEVLTVGDETEIGKIKRFSIQNGAIIVNGEGFEWNVNCVHPLAREKEKYPEGILVFKDYYKHYIFHYYEKQKPFQSYQEFCSYHLKSGAKQDIIWQVRNGMCEILTVGDNARTHNEGYDGYTDIGVIKSFHINSIDNTLSCVTNTSLKDSGYKVSYTHPAQPPEPKTFITEDGFEVDIDDTVYCVNKKLNLWKDNFYKELPNHEGKIHVFKELENAKKFVDLNKPLYSKQQILDSQEKLLSLGSNNLIIIDKQKLRL